MPGLSNFLYLFDGKTESLENVWWILPSDNTLPMPDHYAGKIHECMVKAFKRLASNGNLDPMIWSTESKNNLYKITNMSMQNLSLFGKNLDKEFEILISNDAEFAIFKDLRMALEKYGQNKNIGSSPNVEELSRDMKSKYGWKHVDRFSFAWTFEFNPAPSIEDNNQLDNSLFLSQSGNLYPTDIQGASRLLRNQKKFPKGGLNDLKNFQSVSGFIPLENLKGTAAVKLKLGKVRISDS